MNDPYQVLGVSRTASDDEIKQAYRNLAKKYHPDNYAGSPLADLASEKMSEINSAYDAITQQRKNGASSSPFAQQGGGQYQYQQTSGQFGDVRRLINAGRIFDAEQLLDGTPADSRDAEWHFLKGNVLLARGFLEDATSYLEAAVRMAPQNYEYRAAYDRIMAQRQTGYGGMGNISYSSCDPCGLCATMLCANCLCNSCCRCYYC